MKNLITAALAIGFASSVFAEPATQPSATEKVSQESATRANWKALRTATQELDRLARELKVDQIVAEVEAEYRRESKEVVSRTDSASAGGLFLSGNYHNDVTDWVVTIPREEALIPLKRLRKSEELQAKLDAYVQKNSGKIAEYKAMGVWVLKILNDLAKDGSVDSKVLAKAGEVRNLVTRIVFKGRSAQLECATREYASAKSGGELTLKLLVPLISVGRTVEQKSYVSTSCVQDVAIIEKFTQLAVIDTLDLLVNDWFEQLKVTLMFGVPTDVRPDFDNPYLKY